MKRAIVTGATGAVGTALIRELINSSIETLVFCREGSKRNDQIPKHKLVRKKYCSLDDLADVQNDTGKTFDVFITLGGRAQRVLRGMICTYRTAMSAMRWTRLVQQADLAAKIYWSRVPGGIWSGRRCAEAGHTSISGNGLWNCEALCRADDKRICASIGHGTYLDAHFKCIWPK